MSEKAFPHIEIKNSGVPGLPKQVFHQGMDLRDYFAAKAMQGLIMKCGGYYYDKDVKTVIDKHLIKLSYDMADEAMEVRKNGK